MQKQSLFFLLIYPEGIVLDYKQGEGGGIKPCYNAKLLIIYNYYFLQIINWKNYCKLLMIKVLQFRKKEVL